MKRVIRKFFFAAAIVIAALSNVDAQNSFPYQAVIRTAKGELVSNQEIAMQFSLIYDGKVVYSETQKPKTNQYGNVKVEVGNGRKVSGDFAAVPWSTMQVMMKIEADPNGGTNYIDLGTIQLQPAPYAMYAPAAGAVSTVQAGDPKSDSDALFEVKDKDGNVVFAVYPDGVRVFVNDTASKAVSTGFAVAGRRAAKEGEDANIFEVNAAGTQVFVNEEDTSAGKAMQTGFAVSGRKAAKDGSDLFTVGSTGTQVYIDEDATKAISTGFAVSGRKAAKGEEKYLEINADGTRVYIDNEDDSTKAVRTGFAVSGRRAAKEDSNNKMLEISAEGTKIYVGSDGKVMPTGFAVSGRKAAKGKEIKLFEVNSFGTQIYIDAQNDKAMRTGFAVSGRKAAKDGSPDKYMVIDADGTVIYVDYEEAKVMQTGFAVSGRKAAKDGTQNTILKVDNTEGTRVYIEDVDGKAMQTGFAVSGRKAAKEGETDLMRVTGDNTTIATKSLDMQDKETNKDMMSIAGDNTSIYTDDFSLSNHDDTEMLTANNDGVELKTELVVAGEVAQTVNVKTLDTIPVRLAVGEEIFTFSCADTVPALNAENGYVLLKIYGNGYFASCQSTDVEGNTVVLFDALGNPTALHDGAVAAVIMTGASTPQAKITIWPLKQANVQPIRFGLMAAGDTTKQYVPVEAYINTSKPVECLVDVKSANEDLGKVTVIGPKVYGEKVELLAEPIVEGYHFANWGGERTANPRSVLILHDTAFASANFEINTYIIDAKAENGVIEIIGEQNDDKTFNHGTDLTLKAIADEHYHFMGWTDGEKASERQLTIKSDTAFEAIFAIDSFKIEALAEAGGTVTGAGVYPYGTEIKLVATPDTDNGFHFVNWSDGVTDTARQLTVTEDLNLTASFDKDKYQLTYMVDDKLFKYTTIDCDALIEPIDGPDKTGYTFIGWSGMLEIMPKDNLTVTAEYEINTYNITYNMNGGDWAGDYKPTDTYTIESEEIKLPTIDSISLVGNTFEGWYTSSQFADGTQVTAIAQGCTGDTAFYAKWKLNSYSITIVQAEGGEASVSPDANADGNYTHGTQLSVYANADEESGYEFVKWTAEGMELDKDQVTSQLLVFDIKSNVKLTPEFALMKYHINASADEGGKIESIEGIDQDSYSVHGTKVTITAVPFDAAKYQFAGWESDNLELTEEQKRNSTIEIVVKQAFDITAKFALNTYQVVASNDGHGSVEILGEASTDGNSIYEYGKTIEIKATPESEAYEFDKWTDIEGITLTDAQKQSAQIQNIEVTSEIKLKATFKQKMVVTFNSNGGTFSDDATEKTIYVSNGSAISSTDNPVPTREGYTVIDWLDSDGKPFNFETKITDNITLTAHWVRELYVASRSDGEVGSGTESNPFASVQKAFEAILNEQKTNTDYRIVVVGTLEGGQSIGDFFDDENGEEATTLEGTTITLIGEKNGDELAVLNAEYTGDEETDVALLVYTNIPVIIENLTITGGGSRDGGGILVNGAVEDGIMSHVTLSTGAIVTNNYVLEGGGGGVSVNGEGSTFKMLPGSKITNNIAGTEDDVTNGGSDGQGANGGGVYVGEGSVFVMAGGVISGNEAVSPESDYGHYYGRGGGVYNEGVMYMYGSAVIGDTTKKEVPKTDAHSNMAKNGGGIFNNCGKLWIGYKPAENEGGEPVADNDFAGGIAYNYASANGGGIGLGGYLADESNHIYKGKIAYNAAAEEGGGIGRISDNYGHGALYIDNSTIVGNAAGKNGGGLVLNNNYLEIENMSVKNTTISNNTAGNDGGGLYFGGEKPIQLSNCIVTDNVTGSDGNGGGIYFDGNDSSFALDYCQVTGNSALRGAGVYLVGDGELHMNSGSITDNVLHEDPNEEDIYDDPHGKGVFINYSSEMYVSGAPIVDEVYGEYPTVVYIELEKIEVYDDYGYSYYEDGEPLQLSSGARITVTPEEYNSPSVNVDYVSYGTEIIGNCTANNYEYFTVTPNDEHDWVINEEGYLTYECTVEFTGDGTGRISNQTVMLGGKIDNPTDELQEQEGRCFAGWVDDKNQFFYPDYSVVTDDMTLTAQWVKPFNDIYVNATAGYSANDSDKPQGDVDNQFTTIQDAVNLIASFNQSDLDYTIHVTGMDNNSVIIPEDRSYSVEYYDEEEEESKTETVSFKIANSILVKGETDESGLQISSQPLQILTSVPVNLQNIKIMPNGSNQMVAEIGDSADVTIYNTEIKCENTSSDDGHQGAVIVHGKLTMNGNSSIHGFKFSGSSSNNYDDYTGGVYVYGDLVMNGTSSIYSCTGGGIRISGGSVTMNGEATIGGEGNGCNAGNGKGGGVYVKNGSLTMNDKATISYCTSQNGGGVYMEGESSFTMKSADNIISNCAASYAAGVYVGGGSTFIMENGKINNNNGSYRSGSDYKYTDGGVCIDAVANYVRGDEIKLSGKFIMKGGEVRGNTGNGVSVSGAYIDYEVYNHYGYRNHFAVSGVFDMQGGTITGNTNGYGVYVHASAQANSESAHRSTTGLFKIQPQATVTDAVYLEYAQNSYGVSQAQVTIAGALQNELMITPKNYNTTLPLVAVAEDAETTFEANLSKFKVSPYMPLGCNMASCYNMGNDGTVCVDVTNTCLSISEMTEDGTIAITGKIADSDQDAWLQSIASAIRDGERKITLDLSDMSEVTKIDESAFENCSNLEGIVLPQGITEIVGRAFLGTSIALIDIPDGVTTIGANAFAGCENLESVVLPASLTTIGTDAFAVCSNLKTIYFRGTSDQMSELLIGISDDDPLKKAQWICNSVSLYVSPNGSDGYYNGQTAAKPCQNMDGIRGGKSIFDKIRNDFSQNNNIIVFVDGTMTGQYTLYATDDRIDGKDVYGFNGKVASITFCGLHGLRNGAPIDVFDGNDMNKDVFTIKTTVPITFKNVKITNGKRGVFACGSGSSNRCNVILGSGSVVTGNGSSIDNSDCCGVWVFIADVTLDGGKITANKGNEGGGVHLSHSEYVSKFTMKSGSIEANEAQICGGVYVTSGTSSLWSVFSMQGGTIRGNTATTTEGKGVYIYGQGTFEMSGSAYINPDNDVWFSDKIKIAGFLTTDGTVATITPSSYSTNTLVLTGDASLLSAASGKFAVSPHEGVRYVVNIEGKLVQSSALGGKFTINANGDYVYFSPGNLQYKASGGGTWRFAEKQYDVIGSANENIGNSTYSGYIDLFGWGTGDHPTEKDEVNSKYDHFTDWGTNAINGVTKWRTLTNDEWDYLISNTCSNNKHGIGKVNNVPGHFLLPDDWSQPNGVADFIPGFQESFANNYADYSGKNEYTIEQWAIMEQAGAVFLPSASARNYGDGAQDGDTFGHYWTSTPSGDDNNAWSVEMEATTFNTTSYFERSCGFSVRLVQDR